MAIQAASSSSSVHRVWKSSYYDEYDAEWLFLRAAAGNNVPQLEYAQSLLSSCTVFDYEYIDKVVEKAGERGSVDVILRIVGMCGEPKLANELFNAALAAAASAEQVSAVERLVQSVNRNYTPLAEEMLSVIDSCCFKGSYSVALNLLTFCDLTEDKGEREGYALIRSLITAVPENLREILSERNEKKYMIPDRFIYSAYCIAIDKEADELAKELDLVFRQHRPELFYGPELLI